MDLQDKPKTV